MSDDVSRGRYPGYDVLDKRNTPSWNDRTRQVIDARLAVEDTPRFFALEEWRTLRALCDRVAPQPAGRPRVPVAALVDRQLAARKTKGFRLADMPQPWDAWRRALAALEEVALRDHGRSFAMLTASDQDAVLQDLQHGKLTAAALDGMPPKNFWDAHVNHDVIGSYYSHPEAWNEIGWAGPASPRGYVRLDLDNRDPWEPTEAKPGREAQTERANKRVI
ncbi:gluconate 2-dehydrogenase subunit 3 family protein [Aureimonas leprariae]|uniref:Gluconate 2-dehydrogenase subunit 3 family protein n=1 Tax=Plantimonas leprariae TaxID=2615207 RepID=A0A7V7PJW3_9HYPH|nr:gluconate 2-dehydrogenase subunit 3 family protein [Aureimonas leprariae]KAB0675612.1 gluconate 2-dehydrogenase subunit 3 family protein [Aureimonas leprariae]